jgi:hypothetical protein
MSMDKIRMESRTKQPSGLLKVRKAVLYNQVESAGKSRRPKSSAGQRALEPDGADVHGVVETLFLALFDNAILGTDRLVG